MTNEKGPLAEVDTGSSGDPDRAPAGTTGAADADYDLISLLYHATHGAWSYDRYIEDADREGDKDLAGFFREVRDENARRAARAKKLLLARLS